MILCIFGTTGELIKLMPVLKRLDERGHPVVLASTGQQVNQIPRLLELAGLPQVDLWLARGARGRDLRTNADIPGWAAAVARRYLAERRRLRRRLASAPGRPLVLVHGDTMTTLYGAALGRLMRFPVGHIESGLRSFDLRHPFPEELNRRLTSRVAQILYAPGAWAASNLSRGTVVDTGSNTMRDALAMADDEPRAETVSDKFGIASLHRFELMNDRDRLGATISALQKSQRRLVWIDHPVTVAACERFGLITELSGMIERTPRMDFFSFVRLLRKASFVVTDSGGSQEETFYLDIPCLVHRKRTERREGLGENVVLSDYRPEVLAEFLADPSPYRRRTALPAESPSDVIVADLEARGYAA